MTPAQLCAAALLWLTTPTEAHRATCEAVATEAAAQGVPPSLAVAVAYTESRFEAAAVSPRGAVGPLQVIPRWHCLDGEDDLECGIKALGRLVERYGLRRGLCVYAVGNAARGWQGCAYARSVLGRARRLEK
jgi:hypothetical protein